MGYIAIAILWCALDSLQSHPLLGTAVTTTAQTLRRSYLCVPHDFVSWLVIEPFDLSMSC